MADIAPRLQKVYSAVKEDQKVPVIVVTDNAPTREVSQAISRAGNSAVGFTSALGNAVGVRVTAEEAKRISQLPGVRSIHYDEPIGPAR